MNAITKEEFGRLPSGEIVFQFTLRNRRGMLACVINYGAILTQLHVPDARGNLANVVLGFDKLDAYLAKHPYFGAIVGRFANRIAGAAFTLDGETYTLAANDGANSLHGGAAGFDRKLWTVVEDAGEAPRARVHFACASAHLEEGYPGNLILDVVYELTDENALVITYKAICDRATPVNFTNHSYFNLAGAGQGDVLDHQLTVFASSYTPVNSSFIPSGEIAPVAGTAFDFNSPCRVGARIHEVPGGYDHNFVLDSNRNGGAKPAPAAVLSHLPSKRSMKVHTTEPGVQIYTGNFLDGSLSGLGGTYHKHYGICLETQHFPDSVHQSHFPNVILRCGEEYRQTTIFDFAEPG